MDLKQAALALLARREHSQYELIQKLKRKGIFDQDSIESMIAELADQGLQSDQRYAEMIIRHRAQQGYGPLRIRQELSQIDSSILTAAWAETPIDWQACALSIYHKKYRHTVPQDFKEKQKRQQFMFTRGFSRACIEYCVSAKC